MHRGTGPLNLCLTVRSGYPGQVTLRAVGRDLPVKKEGDTLAFELPGPGQFCLQLPVQVRLLVRLDSYAFLARR